MKNEQEPSSFRDPAGFLFSKDGVLYRHINSAYQKNYDQLIASGLYQVLVDKHLLIPHHEVSKERPVSPDAYKVIKPERVPFVSYPYEWCFGQLKDAALLTLTLQKKALASGMTLKDASAYNVQFQSGAAIWIDTLSFETYQPGSPWRAYRQFCQHFLAPLALSTFIDARLQRLLQTHLDGIPLDLASSLLPFRTRFKSLLLTHIHLHAKSQTLYQDRSVSIKDRRMSLFSLRALVDSLETAVKQLEWNPKGTWTKYYRETNYSQQAFECKRDFVSRYVQKLEPEMVWDLGSNTGIFSRISAKERGIVIAIDSDPAVVELLHRDTKKEKTQNILPLWIDLTNPSPALGWAHNERRSLLERSPADLVLALALVHHLAIAHNVPLPHIAKLLSRMSTNLIIEFIPKSDSHAQQLLASREDIFPNYTIEGFEKAFGKYFAMEKRQQITDSERVLYAFKKI